MSDSTNRPASPAPGSRRRVSRPAGTPPGYAPGIIPGTPGRSAPVRPDVPPTAQPTAQPNAPTPRLTEEELLLAQRADATPPQYIQGYDPARVPPPNPQPHVLGMPYPQAPHYQPSYVESRPMPSAPASAYQYPAGAYELPDEADYDPRHPGFAARNDGRDDSRNDSRDDGYVMVEEDDDDPDDDEQPLAAAPWEDGEYVAPPPTAMPVEYSKWLDLGDMDDLVLAQRFRGWKIKIRRDLSLDFLAAAEALQDAARSAKLMERQTSGRVRAEVRVEHIRAVLSDILVAWNYVDERGRAMAQPPAGLGGVRGTLLAATLNRALQEVVPGKKRLRASTPR